MLGVLRNIKQRHFFIGYPIDYTFKQVIILLGDRSLISNKVSFLCMSVGISTLAICWKSGYNANSKILMLKMLFLELDND